MGLERKAPERMGQDIGNGRFGVQPALRRIAPYIARLQEMPGRRERRPARRIVAFGIDHLDLIGPLEHHLRVALQLRHILLRAQRHPIYPLRQRLRSVRLDMDPVPGLMQLLHQHLIHLQPRFPAG